MRILIVYGKNDPRNIDKTVSSSEALNLVKNADNNATVAVTNNKKQTANKNFGPGCWTSAILRKAFS
jgi:hypothetical protein